MSAPPSVPQSVQPCAPHQALRAATAVNHAGVDAGFGNFDLATREGYVGFLRAHARALPAVEAALAESAAGRMLRPRAGLIAADLAALGESLPAAPTLAAPVDAAAAWGMAYVVEGSRLGGRLLARSVGAALPDAYLADIHQPGEWRVFLAALDEALADPRALAIAIEAARGVFALYAEASGKADV